eukprot:tig00000227_g19807.t1
MSSAAGSSGSGAEVRYWCHECRRHINIPQNTPEPTCPRCNGGFIEEAGEEEDDAQEQPGAVPYPNSFSFHLGGPGGAGGDIFGQLLQSVLGAPPRQYGAPSGGVHMQQRAAPDGAAAGPANPHAHPHGEPQPHAFQPRPPTDFLGIINQLFNGLGMPGQGGGPFGGFPPGMFNIPGFSVQYGGPGGGFGGLDDVITHIMNTYNGPVGTPPASRSAVDELPRLSGADLARRIAQAKDSKVECAVCKDEFETEGAEATAVELPCKHLYHSDCILPWLQQHNSCPVCRFELRTDDPDYEARKASGQHQQAAGGRGRPRGPF